MSSGVRARPRLDYDIIADRYDEPLRDYAADANLASVLDDRPADRTSAVHVLDVGCGTGKQTLANRRRWPGIRLAGVDRSRGMLRIARQRCPDAWWIHGDGAALPFSDNTFDYVTSQFSYHHVGQTSELLHGVFRVLTPGGRFVMTNIDPWSMRGWLVYRYFPAAFDIDARDFLQVEAFVALMEDAGFADIRMARTDLSRLQELRDFLAYASDRHRASQLMVIPDGAYREGIRRLEGDASRPGAGMIRSEFVQVTIAGTRP